MKLRNFLLLACCALPITPAAAFPVIYDLWNAAYPTATADDDLIASAGTPCQICHVNAGGGEPWNQYGFAVLINGGVSNVPQAFFDIEDLDADGEGSSNRDEIDAGALPGWCDTSNPGCENLAWTRAGTSTPATPPAGVTLDPPAFTAPVAQAGGPYAGIAGLRVQFDATSSSDSDGEVVTWHWKFGDGLAGEGPQPVHAYAVAGTYTVHLKITDNDALVASTTAMVVIAPPNVMQAPVADAGGPYTGVEQTPVNFDGSASFDVDGAIVDWQWDFGDGATGSGPTPTHSYALAGVYNVTLQVTDIDGLTASDSSSATISEALGPGETIYRGVCEACHGDPWNGPPVDPSLVAGRRNTGARTCSIDGAINGTAVFPGGVPEMQFLHGAYDAADIQDVSDFLNSQVISGERRYVATCAGCHGNDASGGRVDEDIRGRDAERIYRALGEEPEMAFLNCLPDSDIQAIGAYIESLED